ncbi:hypothetical protein MTP99_003329 [Tenebrio molitor]|jgi:hypothetical protein|nr:hypothetical protein MTP99_003329 [Tenebrio molitor]
MFQHENNTQEVKEVRLPNFGQNFCGTVVSIQSGSKDQCLGLQECSEPLEPPLGSEQTQEPQTIGVRNTRISLYIPLPIVDQFDFRCSINIPCTVRKPKGF